MVVPTEGDRASERGSLSICKFWVRIVIETLIGLWPGLLVTDVSDRCLDQPDGVPGVASVGRAIRSEDELCLQVARVVMGRIEVGDDPRRDTKATQDCSRVCVSSIDGNRTIN